MHIREVLRSNTRLQKTLKDFWINRSCTQYRYNQSCKSRNGVNITRLCVKPYWQYIPHIKSTQKYIVLSRDIIFTNKTYDEYIPRKVNIK